jgi:sugar/nucleoside kinase (ribokinase family)
MKKTLIIGSTVVDVLLSLPALPRRAEDINITSVEYRIGGCAYNVYKTLSFFKSPAILCSPVGSGVHGRVVKEHFAAEGICPIASLETENGCCYCLIEPNGERTFLSHHGAEYLFSRDWLKKIDFSQIGSIYICGLELEEPTGEEILSFVYEHAELELYFAPSPRLMHIPQERMRLFLCRRDSNGKGPFIHLNEKEALDFAGKAKIEEAAEFIAQKTGNSVVITLGEKGCYCLESAGAKGGFSPGYPVQQVNTVGAGDAHFGAIIACVKEGQSLEEACIKANKAGAEVVANFSKSP